MAVLTYYSLPGANPVVSRTLSILERKLMHPLRFIAVLILAGLLNAVCGQTAGPQTTPAKSHATSISTPEMPVLRTNTQLVLVDVVATDHGNPVHDVERQRFHIFEDGREQTITSFDEYRPAAEPAVAAKPLELPPHVYSNVPEYGEASAVNVLLLDGLNTPSSDQLEVRRQMIQYLGKIPHGTPLAIFTLASRLRLVQGFTTNAAQLTKAIQGRNAGAQPSDVLDPQNDKILDTMNLAIASEGWMSPDALPAMLQFQADLTAYQVDMRVRMTIEAMEQLARYLSAIPGRKNLIWFSGAFPIALDPDDTLRSPFQAMRSYTDQMKEASEQLSAARVAVYPVDARGLMTMPSGDASYPSAAPMADTGSVRTQGLKNTAASPPSSVVRDNKSFLRQMQTSQAGMEQLADETGGKAYINTNGLSEAVAHAIENGSSYYTIGYVPTAKDFDGQYRKIQVRLDNSKCQLAYRHGYYADPPDKPSINLPAMFSPMSIATQYGAPPATQILFKARVLPATDPAFQGASLPDTPGEMASTLKGPVHRYVVDLIVVARSITFDEMPDGARQARLELALVAYDADGNRVNYLGHSYTVSPNPEQYTQTLANGVRVRIALDLPAGQVSLRIAVHDMGTGRAGSLEVPLAIAAK
jgi:VWFA-related protein